MTSERPFSHVPNVTDYMRTVAGIVGERRERQRVLDMPAGNGLLADRLRESGHEVICADINRERPDFVHADMEEPLPFEDGAFDTVLCLEGIEHVLDPALLVAELCRVCRDGGRIILSTPNIQSCYSRLTFLFHGHFYQFDPGNFRHRPSPEKVDRGHVSPLSYLEAKYLFECHGATISAVHGDRYKRKVLMPVYGLIVAAGYLLSLLGSRGADRARKDLFSGAALFSRSIILVSEKRATAGETTPGAGAPASA